MIDRASRRHADASVTGLLDQLRNGDDPRTILARAQAALRCLTPEPDGDEAPRIHLPPYPIDVWPGCVRLPVEAAASRVRVTPEIPGMFAAGILAACLGQRWGFYVGSYVFRPLIWGAYVAPSAIGAKTASVQPLLEEMAALDRRREELYDHAKGEWDATQARAKRAKADPPNEPPPPRRQLFANDVTTEALAVVLEDQERAGEGGGLLLYRDELAGWLGSMDVYRAAGGVAKDRPFFLELYNGHGFRVQRVKGASARATRTHCCVVGGIQPHKLTGLGLEDGDGLFSRLMWAFPPPKRNGFGLGRAFPRELSDRWRITLERALGLEEPRVEVESSAIEWLDRRLDEHGQLAADTYYDDGLHLRSTVYARTSEYLARYAAALAGADAIEQGDSFVRVNVALLERAYELALFHRAHGLHAAELVQRKTVGASEVEASGEEGRVLAGLQRVAEKAQGDEVRLNLGELAAATGWGGTRERLGGVLRRLEQRGSPQDLGVELSRSTRKGKRVVVLRRWEP